MMYLTSTSTIYLFLLLCLRLYASTAFVAVVPKTRSQWSCHSSISCSRKGASSASNNLPEPDVESSNFGRKEYWNDFYKDNPSFSWYSGWEDLAPFIQELLPQKSHILIPGVGNDPILVDMYDAGYHHLSAFDYAPEGVACAKQLLGTKDCRSGVTVVVADARDLSSSLFESSSFDAVLEKGTLDAIYLSGGTDKEQGALYLQMAVRELARVVVTGGIFISITAACVDAVQEALQKELATEWMEIRDGSFYMTEDGYTSNNIDGTLFAWKRKEE